MIHAGLRKLALAAALSAACPLPAADTAAEQPATGAAGDLDLFEKRIRPLLLERCVECHGGDSVEASLRLTTRDAVVQGGDSGPAAVVGKPAESLIVQAVEYLGDIQMPPEGKLPESDIAALKQWVAEGMPMPEAPIAVVADPGPQRAFEPTAEHRRWWAFQPLARPAVAGVESVASAEGGTAWVRDDVDRFVLAALQARGLSPAAEADRRTWLRRVTFDLTGLPPTEGELAGFLADDSPLAYERVVDRLLASPAYGERQARHWLDVARYADAYQAGPPMHTQAASFELTEAWRYRDWVVAAFNRDLPFDRFIMRQIAGDLVREPLDAADPDPAAIDAGGLAATTFLTIGSWDHGDADKEKLVSDIVDDQIDTVGKAFLGLTLGCARCHDHKFDPVSTADYYALAGIFYSTRALLGLGNKGDASHLNRVPVEPASLVTAYDEAVAALTPVIKKIAELDSRFPPPAADDPERVALVAERDRLLAAVPNSPRAMAVQEGGVPGGLFPAIQDVPIHVRGSYARLGPVVPRRMPVFFAGDAQPSISEGSGRRELAAWVASADNPLTPRVIVNRVWQWHFGRGLVPTANNFGMLAEPPSHPDLLDWLAATFIDEGWSLKKLHRRIVLSATYRQSSRAEPAAIEADPDNRLLGRFAARRLDAEEIRDAMLVAAGRLTSPAAEAGTGGPAAYDLAVARRSLYVQTTRWERGNFSTLFDAANPDASVEARSNSTVAPQALFLLNHEFVAGIARDLAARLFAEVPGTDGDAARARIRRAWRIALGRPPRDEEIEVALSLVHTAAGSDEQAGWADLAHVLVCGNEFFHVE